MEMIKKDNKILYRLEHTSERVPEKTVAYRDLDLTYLVGYLSYLGKSVCYTAEGTITEETNLKVKSFNLRNITQIDSPSWINTNRESLVKLKFAISCAEAVLPIYEDNYSNKAPRISLQTAIKYYKLLCKYKEVIVSDNFKVEIDNITKPVFVVANSIARSAGFNIHPDDKIIAQAARSCAYTLYAVYEIIAKQINKYGNDAAVGTVNAACDANCNLDFISKAKNAVESVGNYSIKKIVNEQKLLEEMAKG